MSRSVGIVNVLAGAAATVALAAVGVVRADAEGDGAPAGAQAAVRQIARIRKFRTRR